MWLAGDIDSSGDLVTQVPRKNRKACARMRAICMSSGCQAPQPDPPLYCARLAAISSKTSATKSQAPGRQDWAATCTHVTRHGSPQLRQAAPSELHAGRPQALLSIPPSYQLARQALRGETQGAAPALESAYTCCTEEAPSLPDVIKASCGAGVGAAASARCSALQCSSSHSSMGSVTAPSPKMSGHMYSKMRPER